jgi:hypothetical protein
VHARAYKRTSLSSSIPTPSQIPSATRPPAHKLVNPQVLQASSKVASKPRPPLPSFSLCSPPSLDAHLPDKFLPSHAPQNKKAATPVSYRLQQHLWRAIAEKEGCTRTQDFAIIFASTPPILWWASRSPLGPIASFCMHADVSPPCRGASGMSPMTLGLGIVSVRQILF